MPAFVIVTLNPSRDYLWEAHRAGCRDLAQRDGAHGFKSHTQTVEAATVDEAVTQFLDPETRELGWDEAAVLVLPCARRPDAYRVNGDRSRFYRLASKHPAVTCRQCGMQFSTGGTVILTNDPYDTFDGAKYCPLCATTL